MRKYIIATHGHMAYGINTTLNMLIGAQENLTIINATPNGPGNAGPSM